jgi:hypothetical protein
LKVFVLVFTLVFAFAYFFQTYSSFVFIFALKKAQTYISDSNNNTSPPQNTAKPLPSASNNQHQFNQTLLLHSLSDSIFEEICDEVIKCDDKAPSVPDVILQVISEILSENHAAASNPAKAEPSAQSPPPPRSHHQSPRPKER